MITQTMKTHFHLGRLLALALLASAITLPSANAKQGATDPIPGTSKGATNSGGGGGGGGGKSSKSVPTPTPTPTPTPAPTPVVSGTLTFTATGPIGSGTPVCNGNYRIDPYYPTLLDMTLNVDVSSANLPDGTVLYINVLGVGGTLYPYTSNAIVLIGGAGLCSEKVFVTLGAGLAGVEITDASGVVLFRGN